MSCFINPEKIENYKSAIRQKLANSLRAKVEAGEPVDVVAASKEMYNFFKEKGANEALAQDAAASVPFLIDQLITNSKDLANILKKADPEIKIKLAKVMVDYEKDINNVKRDLGIKDNLGQQLVDTQNAVKLSKALEEERTEPPVEVPIAEIDLNKAGYSTTGQENTRNAEGEYLNIKNPLVKMYYSLKRKLINLFSNSVDEGKTTLVYNKEIGEVYLKLVSGSTISKEQRSDESYDQSDAFDKNIYGVVVDKDGKTLYITPEGELKKEGNKVAYFTIANSQKIVDNYNEASAQSKELTDAKAKLNVMKKTIVFKKAASIVKQRNITEKDPNYLKEVQKQMNELLLQSKELIAVKKYIDSNPSEHSVTTMITGGSLGHSGKVELHALKDIKELNAKNTNISTANKKTTIFNIPGTTKSYEFAPLKIDAESSKKFAEFFTTDVCFRNDKGQLELMSIDDKLKYLSQFTYLGKANRISTLKSKVKNLTETNKEAVKADIAKYISEMYQDIILKNKETNSYKDFTIVTEDGKSVIKDQIKKYFEDYLSQNYKLWISLDGEGKPFIFNSYLTFVPLQTEKSKINPEQTKAEEVKVEEVTKAAVVATPAEPLSQPGTADKLKDATDDIEIFKRLGVKATNKKEASSKIARGLIWYSGGRKALNDKTFKSFLSNLSPAEQAAIKAEAEANPEPHPMSKYIPFDVVLAAVNSRESDKVASWSMKGIILYHYYRENGELDGEVSGDFTDIYHEAWHGFTQTFLTQEQRNALYAEASKMPGTFRDYAGKYVTFANADPLQLEEYLAEDFRKYMLSGGKVEIKGSPVKLNIFQKLLNWLKSLYNKATVKDVAQNKDNKNFPTIKDLYSKLKVGDLGGFNFDVNNRDRNIGELEKTIETRSTDPNLNHQDSLTILNTLDSLLSEAVDTVNKEKTFVINGKEVSLKVYTSLYLKNPDGLKAAYGFALNKLKTQIIPELETKLKNAKNDLEKSKAENNLRLAQWAVNNFGDVATIKNNTDGKGVIAYHQMKSKFISFEDRVNFFEDINEDAQNKKAGKIDGKSGNESSVRENADPDIHALLRSLYKFDKDNSPEYNELGVHSLVSYDQIWNKLARLLSNTITEEKMYAKLQEAAKTDGTIAHLLDKIGGLETTRLAESRLWGKFWQTFNLSTIPLIQTNLTETKRISKIGNVTVENTTYSVQIGRASASFKEIGNRWENTFRTRTDNKYIKKDDTRTNYLDLAAIINDFTLSNGTFDNTKRMKFFEALGMIFSDDTEISKRIQNGVFGGRDAIFNRIKELNERNQKITSLKDIFVKYPLAPEGPQLGSIENYYNDLQELQSKFSDDVNNFEVTNAQGEKQFEQSLNNTMTIVANAINNAEDFQSLYEQPYMSFLNPNKNSWVTASVWLNSIFDMEGDGKKRNDTANLKISNLSGIQIITEDGNKGINTSAADSFAKFIQDFHLTVIAGKPELMRHADKTSSFTAYLDKLLPIGETVMRSKAYVETKEFFNSSTNGYNQAYKIIKRYINAELQRANKFRNLADVAKDGNFEFDFNYLKEGQNFVMFEDVLTKDTRIKLLNDEYKGMQLDEIFKLNPTLGTAVKTDFDNYFTKQVDDAKELLSKGDFISPEYINEISGGIDTRKADAKQAALESFTFNSWINNVESTIVLYGDIAQYNLLKDEFHKRNASIASTGKIFRTSQQAINYVNSVGRLYARSKKAEGIEEDHINMDGSFNTAVLEDNIIPSKYVGQIKEAVEIDVRKRFEAKLKKELGNEEAENEIERLTNKAVGNYAGKMEEGNAQGWITFDSYRAFAMLEGNWSDIQESMYRRICAGEELPLTDTIETFPVRKFQYSGQVSNENASIMAFHKYSLMPLIPSVTKSLKIDFLHDKMMKENIVYAVFKTGSKISTITTDDVADKFYTNNTDREMVTMADKPFTKNTLFLHFLKDQLEIAPKYKGHVTFPTQMRKLIESGLMEGGVPVDYEVGKDLNTRISLWDKEKNKESKSKVYTLVKNYENSVSQMTSYLMEELIAEADIKFEGTGDNKKVIFNEKLRKFLIKELERQDLADHEIATIQMGENQTLAHDLSLSMFSDKLEKALNSIVVKRLVKQNFKGEGLIQVAGAGFESKVLSGKLTPEQEKEYGTNDLKFYDREVLEKDANGKPTKYGKTTACQVKISLQGDFINLLNLIHPDGEKVGTLERLNKLIRDKRWLDTGDNRKMITIIGPRIPTQELNSMEFAEVYEFLDPKAGNIVILPSEIVAKSGGDFDVDKITFMFPTIDLINGVPTYAKVNKSIATKDIPAYKTTLKEQVEELYKKKKEIEKRYEDEFQELKATKEFNKLTEDEKTALTKRHDEYKLKKKAVQNRIDDLESSKKFYTNKLTKEYDSEIYDKLVEVEDSLYTENNNLEIVNANWSDTKNTYKSFFRDEKIKAFSNKQKEERDAINQEIGAVKAKLLGISKGAYENNVTDSMNKILELNENYLSLVRPNSVDILKPISETLAESATDYNPRERVHTKDITDEEKKRIPGTKLLEIGFNLYKHQNNNIGKEVLGIFAVGNTYNSLFNRIGLKLNHEYAYGLSRSDETAFTKRIFLALKHNSLRNKDNQDVISMAHLMDANGENYISSTISQLINGSVDVAKDAWLFLIQGNKELGPSLEFMIEAGVPAKQAIYFLSQPLIKEYVEEQRRLKSVAAKPLGENIDNPAFSKNKAIGEMMIKYFGNVGSLRAVIDFAKLKPGQFKPEGMPSYNERQNLIYNYTVSLTDTDEFKNLVSSDNAETNLKDRIGNKTITDLDKAVFLHFLEIEEMNDAVKKVKLSTNFDTSRSNSSYEAEEKIGLAEDLKNNGIVPSDILEKILQDTVVQSFYVQPLQISLFKDMFSLKNNIVFTDFIKTYIKNNRATISSSFDNTSDFLKAFKNALPSFIFQNDVKSFDIDSISDYKGVQIKNGVNIEAIESVMNITSGVYVKTDGSNRTIYLDRNRLKSDYKKFSTIGGEPSYINGQVISKPAKLNINAFTDSESNYYKFVIERELLRSMYDIDEVENNTDFKNAWDANIKDPTKRNLNETDAVLKLRMKVLTYEEMLRDKALDNTLNTWKMFQSEKSYANEFINLVKEFPELEKYNVVANLQFNQSKDQKKIKNLVFGDRTLDSDILNIYHENLMDLSNASKINIKASKEDKARIAEFFDRMPLFAFMQSGMNITSSFSIVRAMPQERFMNIMIPAVANFLNNINPVTLKKFADAFKKVHASNNFTSRSRAANYQIDNYNVKKDLRTSNAEIGSPVFAEPIELTEEFPGVYSFNLDGSETTEQIEATIHANPDTIFIVENTDGDAGQGAFTTVGKQTHGIQIRPSTNEVYRDVTAEESKQIKERQLVEATSTDKYHYYGKSYDIVVVDGKGVDVIGYSGKQSKKQELLDLYNTDPNLDVQRTLSSGSNVYWRNANIYLKNTNKNAGIAPSGIIAVDKGPVMTFADGTVIDTPFKLNDEQTDALLRLEKFAEDINPIDVKGSQITLLGYAGTGKTSIITIFHKYLEKKHFTTPIYSSPTHRANAVTKLKNPTAKVFTLHALFGLKGQINLEDGDYDMEDLEFAAKDGERRRKIQTGDVLIVDEASMINDALYEFLQEFKEKLGLKIIYMGDPAQLKPVKQDHLSKALEEGEKIYLTKVERTGDNPILEESTNLRNGKNFNYVTKLVGDQGVIYSGARSFMRKVIAENYGSEEFKTNKLYFRILSGTNAEVREANTTTRELLYGDNASKQILVGDLVMGYNNFAVDFKTKQPKIMNSGDYEVTNVSPGKKNVELNGKVVEFSGYNISIKNLLSSNLDITSVFVADNNESDSKLTAFANEISRLNIEGEKMNRLGRTREAAQYFSAAEVLESSIAFMKELKDSNGKIKVKKTFDYGYAHTIHKSQGGTYNRVLILADTINSFKKDIQLQQQLKYVAMSRASEQVFISTEHTLGTPEIKPATSVPVTQSSTSVEKFSYARTSNNSYEVSTAGDSRFSALNAKLKDGRTIEEAYQLDIKGYRKYKPGEKVDASTAGEFTSEDKNGKEIILDSSKATIVKEDTQDPSAVYINIQGEEYSVSKREIIPINPSDKNWKNGKGKKPLHGYSEVDNYLFYKDLWSQWAKENPSLLEDLRQKAQGKVLTDKFASSPVSQARALADILNETTATTQPSTSVVSTNKFTKKNIFTVKPQAGVSDNKAKVKASIATQYIGFGEGIVGKDGKRSTTQLYKEQIIIMQPFKGYQNMLWYYFVEKAKLLDPSKVDSIKNAKDYHSAWVIGKSINNTEQSETLLNDIYKEALNENKLANTGNYSADDVIFVSIPGARGDEAIAKREQDKTIKEAIKAVEAGATILTDNKKYIDSSAYNTGEKKLYNAMQDKRYNYSEITVDGQTIGTWSKPTQSSTSVKPTDFTNYHGGAKKYDTYWEQEGKTFGVTKHTVYTVDSYDKLDQTTKDKLNAKYDAARTWLGRSNLSKDTYAGKLVRRDMMQAAKADGIFAISEIVAPGTKGRKGYVNKTNHPIIEGGTGYAVASGILLNKPVYVFNQDSSYGYETGWYKWDSSANNFVKTDVPVLTKNYAGIGSSTNETEIGRQAIRDVYANTFKEKSSTQQQAPVQTQQSLAPGQVIVNPIIKKQIDDLITTLKEAKEAGKNVAYLRSGIAQYMMEKDSANNTIARQTFIYLSEQLLKFNIMNPKFERTLLDPQNQTGITGKSIIEQHQKDEFGVSNDDAEDNLIYCSKE